MLFSIMIQRRELTSKSISRSFEFCPKSDSSSTYGSFLAALFLSVREDIMKRCYDEEKTTGRRCGWTIRGYVSYNRRAQHFHDSINSACDFIYILTLRSGIYWIIFIAVYGVGGYGIMNFTL